MKKCLMLVLATTLLTSALVLPVARAELQQDADGGYSNNEDATAAKVLAGIAFPPLGIAFLSDAFAAKKKEEERKKEAEALIKDSTEFLDGGQMTDALRRKVTELKVAISSIDRDKACSMIANDNRYSAELRVKAEDNCYNPLLDIETAKIRLSKVTISTKDSVEEILLQLSQHRFVVINGELIIPSYYK